MSIQLQAAGHLVSDTALSFGGLQMIRTNTGHQIPIKIVGGLTYIDQRPVTDKELNDDNIPHVIMTSPGEWNPRIYDDNLSHEEHLRRMPSTPIDETELFYNPDGTIDLHHVKETIAHSACKSDSFQRKRTVSFSTLPPSTNDGTPWIPLHKRKDNNVTDTHPQRTGTIIERDGYLYLERNDHGDISYDTVPLYDNVDRTVNLINQSTEYWSTCNESFLQSSRANLHPVSAHLLAEPVLDESYDSSPRPFEHEYWTDSLGLDDAAI